MLRSPKERFITSVHAAVWKITIGSESTEEAFHSALCQMCDDSPTECHVPQVACDAHQQLIGARKILDILSTLHIPTTPNQVSKPKGLDYSVGI